MSGDGQDVRMYGGERRALGALWGGMKEIAKSLGLDGRATLKCITTKQNGVTCIGLAWLRIRISGRFL